MTDISIVLIVVFGIANLLDRHYIAKKAAEATAANLAERTHLIHLIAARTPAEVVTLERSTKPPAPKDPETPGFRHNPIS